MSMLTLTGKLIHIFETPKGERDGKAYDSQDKIQILGCVSLPNGEIKNELLTLTTHDKHFFVDLVGKDLRVPIGVFAQSSSVTYFIPRGSKPEVIQGKPLAHSA